MYCTGSEASTNTEDNSSSDGTSSTPETVYDSNQYKIFHQQKKNELPFHLDVKKPVNKSFSIPKNSYDVTRSRILVDPKNLNHPLGLKLESPENRLNINKNTGKIIEKGLDKSWTSQTKQKNALSKDESKDTLYTMSTNYPSTHDGISRESTYSSVLSGWSYLEAESQHSSWKESHNSRSGRSASAIRSEAYEDSLEDIDRNRQEEENRLLCATDLLDESEKDEQWWMNYVFNQLDLNGNFFYCKNYF